MKRALVALLLLLPAAALSQTAPEPNPMPEIAAPQPATPASPPSDWLPGQTARIEVLNKVDAVSRDYTVPVGQSVQVGSMTIAVKECASRPPDRPSDAAAYLAITDSHPDDPGFTGWMLAAEPWVAMLQSPLYDVRVLRCDQ